LAQQLENLLPLIDSYSPNQCDTPAFLAILQGTPKIRSHIYNYIANRAINYTQIIESISKINWDLHDIMSQHNEYVELLLRQVKNFISDVEMLKEDLPSIEKQTMSSLLEQVIKLIMRTLVEGYSTVKKCSNEGRALMQLDFQQLIVNLEKICDLKQIPDKDFVDLYIKAYYLPESSIEKWIKEHDQYSTKHLTTLLGTMAQVTRKTRTAIISSFDNFEKT
jgi:syndetin